MSEWRGGAVGWAFAIGFLAAWLSVPVASQATTIRLVNHDGPNEGFNDATPALPVGGNPGTTIGAQRQIAFQRALDLWGAQLDSAIEIRVGATFDELTCNSTSVTLGTAGPTNVYRDFAGAPLPDTWYPAALADHLAGMDLDPGDDDIDANFNSRFGTTCTFPAGWYYGLDGQPMGDDSDLVTVVLHEIGHGLGFLSLIDIQNGSRFSDESGPHNDVFMSFLVDDETGKHFDEITDAERRSALVDTGHLKWDGEEVVQSSNVLTSGVDASGRVEMYAPPQPQNGSSVSHWSDELFPDELMEPFFTHAIHDVGLAGAALLDIGWGTPVVPPLCAADCDMNGIISVAELVRSVSIALGTSPLSVCPSADADNSGSVAVNELVGAVDRALNGCP